MRLSLVNILRNQLRGGRGGFPKDYTLITDYSGGGGKQNKARVPTLGGHEELYKNGLEYELV